MKVVPSLVRLVSKDKEPITPFISKVRSLYDTLKVSSILVIGGCGDYFEVADTVIMMDCYTPKVKTPPYFPQCCSIPYL